MMTVDIDAILSALSASSANPVDKGEGYTLRELVDMTNTSEHAVRKRLRELHRDGAVRTSKKIIDSISGHTQRVTSYVFAEAR